MRIYLFVLFALILSACSSKTPYPIMDLQADLEIIEIHPNKWTAMSKQNLLHLHKVYDLTPFTYQSLIYIQPGPHSFWSPKLTLSATQAEKPYNLLARFLYFQMHWFLKNKHAQIEKTKYSNDMIAQFLEWRALRFYLGKVKAKEVFIANNHEAKNSDFIFKQEKEIFIKLKQHQLIPPQLATLTH